MTNSFAFDFIKSNFLKMLLITSIAFFLFINFSTAQNLSNQSLRSGINESLAPFLHGVASGDPLTDRVIIWTRVTPDGVVGDIDVTWDMAVDTAFLTIVTSGSFTTNASIDYTVKVDVTGLQPNNWYYYRFTYNGGRSVTGRTRTLPVGNVTNLRFAVTSCQDFQAGLYNAQLSLSERNDIDAVIFLGDYIYDDFDNNELRDAEPPFSVVQVDDYRIRYSQYRLDRKLQAAHQQFPWINVWDDHEFAGNAFTDGAEDHDPLTDGDWNVRKSNAVQVFYEWLPVRIPNPNDSLQIFRKFSWGNLLDLHMVDGRIFDRSQEAPRALLTPINDPIINDTNRTMMGPVQLNWFRQSLNSSTAQWQIMGQQVVMSPIILPFNGDQIFSTVVWDGYIPERERLYKFLQEDSIKNLVVITGDAHLTFANDLALPGYDTLNRNISVGVEFVATALSSRVSSEDIPTVLIPLVQGRNPYLRFFEFTRRGYFILDVNTQRVQADFYFVSNADKDTFSTEQFGSWFANNNEPFLNPASTPAVPATLYPDLAPVPFDFFTSVRNKTKNIVLVSAHPNPFFTSVTLQFDAPETTPVDLKVMDMQGKIVVSKTYKDIEKGINHIQFKADDLQKGNYIIYLSGKNYSISKTVIKL